MERGHGQETDEAEIRSSGAEKGRESDAQAQARHVAQWALGQEGQESQAGDRDRTLGGAARRRQSSKKAIQVLSGAWRVALFARLVERTVDRLDEPDERFVRLNSRRPPSLAPILPGSRVGVQEVHPRLSVGVRPAQALDDEAVGLPKSHFSVRHLYHVPGNELRRGAVGGR